MLRAVTAVSIFMLATGASAQYRRPPPEYYPPSDSIYRGTERIMCVVDPGLERYRSRPTCELGSWQPLGTRCACPSFQSQGQRELPGRVVRR
jgi:hypothetical protein